MKKKLIVGLGVVFVVLIATTLAFSYNGWRIQNWDKSKVTTIEGKVTFAYGAIINVDAKGKEYIVHLGRPFYWQNQDVKIEKGTSVKITGMTIEIDGKMNMYPQSVVIGQKEIKVADENGIPVWAGNAGWAGKGGRFRQGRYGCRYW